MREPDPPRLPGSATFRPPPRHPSPDPRAIRDPCRPASRAASDSPCDSVVAEQLVRPPHVWRGRGRDPRPGRSPPTPRRLAAPVPPSGSLVASANAPPPSLRNSLFGQPRFARYRGRDPRRCRSPPTPRRTPCARVTQRAARRVREHTPALVPEQLVRLTVVRTDRDRGPRRCRSPPTPRPGHYPCPRAGRSSRSRRDAAAVVPEQLVRSPVVRQVEVEVPVVVVVPPRHTLPMPVSPKGAARASTNTPPPSFRSSLLARAIVRAGRGRGHPSLS